MEAGRQGQPRRGRASSGTGRTPARRSGQVKRSALESLLKREARKAWTPRENWLVVGTIAAGVALLHIPFLGIPLLIFGLWRRSVTNKRHRAVLLGRYPHLFGRLQS